MPQRIPTHTPHPRAKTPDRSPEARARAGFYSTARWRGLRAAYAARHPLCERCQAKGDTTAARHVHHIHPIETHPELSLSWDNLEALCIPCHTAHHKASQAT